MHYIAVDKSSMPTPKEVWLYYAAFVILALLAFVKARPRRGMRLKLRSRDVSAGRALRSTSAFFGELTGSSKAIGGYGTNSNSPFGLDGKAGKSSSGYGAKASGTYGAKATASHTVTATAKAPRGLRFKIPNFFSYFTPTIHQERTLNVIFNYNGHSWDAYEVLGLPAGSPFDKVSETFQTKLQTIDAASKPFLSAAFDAIRTQN